MGSSNKLLQNLTFTFIIICGISVFLPWTNVIVRQFSTGSGLSIINESGSGYDRDEGIGFIIVLAICIYQWLNHKYNVIIFFGIVYMIYGIGMIVDWSKASDFVGTGDGYVKSKVTAKFGIYVFIISACLFGLLSYYLKRREKHKVGLDNLSFLEVKQESAKGLTEQNAAGPSLTSEISKKNSPNINSSRNKYSLGGVILIVLFLLIFFMIQSKQLKKGKSEEIVQNKEVKAPDTSTSVSSMPVANFVTDTLQSVAPVAKKLQYLFSSNAGLLGFYNDGTVSNCARCDLTKNNIDNLLFKEVYTKYKIRVDYLLLDNGHILDLYANGEITDDWVMVDYKWIADTTTIK